MANLKHSLHATVKKKVENCMKTSIKIRHKTVKQFFAEKFHTKSFV